jgi:hypothetical protein
MEHFFHALALFLAALLSIAGIALSCISISGTWLVVVGAGLTAIVRPDSFPGLGTVVVFILVAGLVELFEFLAGWIGVTGRGGSRLSAVAAVAAGLAGAVIGGILLPVPVLGSIAGMTILSFAAVFAIELRRLKKRRQAANIALGVVTARVMVIFAKTAASLGMTVYLTIGIISA